MNFLKNRLEQTNKNVHLILNPARNLRNRQQNDLWYLQEKDLLMAQYLDSKQIENEIYSINEELDEYHTFHTNILKTFSEPFKPVEQSWSLVFFGIFLGMIIGAFHGFVLSRNKEWSLSLSREQLLT